MGEEDELGEGDAGDGEPAQLDPVNPPAVSMPSLAGRRVSLAQRVLLLGAIPSLYGCAHAKRGLKQRHMQGCWHFA